jgi:hypothetical protein
MLTSWQYHRLYRRFSHCLYGKLYRDDNRDFRNSIILAGTARSGTTWLADLIASQVPCRLMFEPFHPTLVDVFSQFHYFHYMRPSDHDIDLLLCCKKIVSGDIRNPWIDRQVEYLFPKYRLIKEIRANLFLKWIHDSFPQIPVVLLVRHPCAVVLSRMQLQWATDKDIASFLRQPKLVEDFLSDKMDVIERAKTDAQKHAVIWSVHHLVPFKQFRDTELNVFFYESLCTQPQVEIPRLFRVINQKYSDSVYEHLPTPSLTTTNHSAAVTGSDQISRWQKELPEKQIREVLSVVDAFGLGHIYGSSVMPFASGFEGIAPTSSVL